MISMHANTSPKHSVYYYGKAETTEKNPMSRLNKGFKKGKYYHREEEEQQQYHRPLLRCEPQAETELRFSNLSANKQNMYFSQNRVVANESGGLKKQAKKPIQFSEIRRKLQYEDVPNSKLSKGKSPSFTDIIRQSRQKNLRSGSKIKGIEREIKAKNKSTKQVASFNKLKARLMGQKAQKTVASEQVQMVRVSFAFAQNPVNESLNMQPTI